MFKFLGNIFKGDGDGIVGKMGNLVDRFVRTKDEKAEFEREMQQIFHEAEQADQLNVTARWKLDMTSDSWLSKNIRPLALAFMTLMLVVIIILDASMTGFVVGAAWIALLQTLLLTIYAAYFGGRSLEKWKKTVENNNKK